MKVVDKVIQIPCSTSAENDFFARWVRFLKPIHGLTAKEQEVLATILRNRHRLSLGVTDPSILDEICLNLASRNAIRDNLKISNQQLNFIFKRLRDTKVLVPSYKMNGKIDYYRVHPNYIPSIDTNTKTYNMLLVFKLDVEQEDKTKD